MLDYGECESRGFFSGIRIGNKTIYLKSLMTGESLFLFFDHEKKLKWAEACANDPEIRDYLIKRLTMIIKSYKNKTREVEDMKQVLQSKDED